MRSFLTAIMLLMIIVAACNTAPSPQAEASPQVIAKVLATVYISPTPNAEQLQATRFAVSPTPSPAPPTPSPQPTAYIGVFIGEAQVENDLPRIQEPLIGGATPLPTANPRFCPIAIDVRFLDSWLEDNRVSGLMGCPIQEAFGFFGDIQILERGVMYRRRETDEVWAILPGSSNFGRYYYVERPAPLSTEGLNVPQGLTAPTGAFGSVWSSIAGLRDLMGFARTEVQEVGVNIQRFNGGTFFLDVTSEQVYALIVDGTYFGPYLAPAIIPDGP